MASNYTRVTPVETTEAGRPRASETTVPWVSQKHHEAPAQDTLNSLNFKGIYVQQEYLIVFRLKWGNNKTAVPLSVTRRRTWTRLALWCTYNGVDAHSKQSRGLLSADSREANCIRPDSRWLSSSQWVCKESCTQSMMGNRAASQYCAKTWIKTLNAGTVALCAALKAEQRFGTAVVSDVNFVCALLTGSRVHAEAGLQGRRDDTFFSTRSGH